MSPLKTRLHGQKTKEGGPTAPANRILLERLLERMSIEGAPLFEAASHGLIRMT